MERDYSYDYLRAFAAIMIVLCHVCQGFGISPELGYYLGGTYVDVFLLLSAYLLGISQREKIAQNPFGFLKKRSGRIVPTYYTFLLVSFLIILIFIGISSLNIRQILGHLFFLNWFVGSTRIYAAPLPQLGHLWFMSCIIMSYVLVTLYAIAIQRHPALNSRKAWIAYAFVFAILATIVTTRIRFAVYPFTVFLGFILLFFKGREIMDWARSLKPALVVSLLVIGNILGITFYAIGGYAYPPYYFG